MIVYAVAGVLATLFAGLSQWARSSAPEQVRRRGHSHPGSSRRQRRARSPKGSGRIFAALCGLVLVVVGAFRWRVGTDYPNYVRLYPDYLLKPLSQYKVYEEPGLPAIAKLGAVLYDDYAMMLGLASAITITLFVRTIYKLNASFAFSIALFVLTGPWLGSFNGVRQFLACAVVFAGHRLILDRKFLKYAGIVFLATLFHISALVTILFYFVPRRRLTVLSGGIVVLASLVVAESYGRILDVVAAIRPDGDLTTDYVTREIDPLRIAVAFAPLALYLLVTNKRKLGTDDHFYVQLLLVNAATFVASAGSAYIARFAVYTAAFICVALPRLIPKDQTPLFRQFLTGVILLAYCIFFYVEVSGVPELARFLWIFQRSDGGLR